MPSSPLTRVKDCPYPATQSGAERRVADMVLLWEKGDYQAVLTWLRRLGCKVDEMEQYLSWAVDGLTGVRCSLMAKSSAIDTFAQMGIILAGPFWPMVFPNLPKMVDRLSKERKKVKGTTEQPKKEDDVVREILPSSPPMFRKLRGT